MSAYSAAVLADAPAAYYRLGETSGAVATDSSGNGHDGTYTNVGLKQQGSLTGDLDWAGLFNGSNSYVTIPNASWNFNATALSVEAWIRTTAAGAVWDHDEASTSGHNRVFQFTVNSSGKVVFTLIGGTGGIVSATSTASVNDNKPHHVVGTYDGATISVYVDGVLSGSAARAGTLLQGTADMHIGVNYEGAYYTFFNGGIDEAAYYTSVLSATQVANHYAARSATIPASLGDITDLTQWTQNNVKINNPGVEVTLSNSSAWCATVISNNTIPLPSLTTWSMLVTYSLYVGSGADTFQFGLVNAAIPKTTIYGGGVYGNGAGIYGDSSFFGFMYDVYGSQLIAWANGAQVNAMSYSANRDAYHTWAVRYVVNSGSLTMTLLCDGAVVMTSNTITAPTYPTLSPALGERNGGSGATFKAQGTPTAALLDVTGHTLTGLSANGGNNQIQASWNADPSALSYDYSLDGGTTISNTTSASVIISGLTNGTAYTLQVRPVSVSSTGNWASVTVTPSPTGLTVYLKDTFTRADSATTLGSPEVGGPYTVLVGTWGVASGQAYVPSGTGKAVVTFPAAIDVDATFQASNYLGGPSFLFRYVDANNYWRLMNYNNGWTLGRWNAGAWAYNPINASATYATDVARVVAIGTRIYLFINGILRWEQDDYWYTTATATCGFLIDGTNAGRIDNVLVQTPELAQIPGLMVDGSVANAQGAAQILAATPAPFTGFAYLGHGSRTADAGAL